MVARLFAPQFVILYLFAASAAYVHFRGKMKLRLGRQLADHSTWLAPYNVLMYMFQSVPNKPVHAVSNFPELAPLRDNWQTIREEALNLFDEGRIGRLPTTPIGASIRSSKAAGSAFISSGTRTRCRPPSSCARRRSNW